jgi:hypothetical protein
MKTFYITIGLLAWATLGFAVTFLTDPWGTRIKLTERAAQQ